VTLIVSMDGTSSETKNLHAWQDKRHLYSKQRKRKEGNPLLPSVEAVLNQTLQQLPDIKTMAFAEAKTTLIARICDTHPRLMEYFAPDDE
jgi:hypothetical protein